MSPSEVEQFDQAIRQFKRLELQMTIVNTGVNKYKKVFDEANGDKKIKWTIVHWLSIDVNCLQCKKFRKCIQRVIDQLFCPHITVGVKTIKYTNVTKAQK